MEYSQGQTLTKQNQYFNLFLEGNEKGLEFFYQLFYPRLYYSGLRYIKDDVNAACIVSEAFLRLWISRKIITEASEIEGFLKKLTATAYKQYFKTSKNSFHRNMLRLDELEHYQDFMAGQDPWEKEDEETSYFDETEIEVKKQWQKVQELIPHLHTDQQMFIRLCLKFGFDYGRIAWHIGGISDYQVARKVEKTLACLKGILSNTQKLETVSSTPTFKFEGDVCAEQATILHLRYQLQYSFAEIATSLGLEQGYIQQAFVGAALKIKKIKP